MFQPLITGSNFVYIEYCYAIGKFIRKNIVCAVERKFRACRAYSVLTQQIKLASNREFMPLWEDFQQNMSVYQPRLSTTHSLQPPNFDYNEILVISWIVYAEIHLFALYKEIPSYRGHSSFEVNHGIHQNVIIFFCKFS